MPIKIPMALNGSFMESGQEDIDSADEGPLQASSSLADLQVPVSTLLSHASIVCLLRLHPCRLTRLAQLDPASATFAGQCRRDPRSCLIPGFPTGALRTLLVSSSSCWAFHRPPLSTSQSVYKAFLIF